MARRPIRSGSGWSFPRRGNARFASSRTWCCKIHVMLPYSRTLASPLIAPSALIAQIGPTDLRNTQICHTDYRFSMPKYASLAEWEARKADLRKQILLSAGLLPMPEKTPLHAQISGRIEHKDYTVEKVAVETMPGYY